MKQLLRILCRFSFSWYLPSLSRFYWRLPPLEHPANTIRFRSFVARNNLRSMRMAHLKKESSVWITGKLIMSDSLFHALTGFVKHSQSNFLTYLDSLIKLDGWYPPLMATGKKIAQNHFIQRISQQETRISGAISALGQARDRFATLSWIHPHQVQTWEEPGAWFEDCEAWSRKDREESIWVEGPVEKSSLLSFRSSSPSLFNSTPP